MPATNYKGEPVYSDVNGTVSGAAENPIFSIFLRYVPGVQRAMEQGHTLRKLLSRQLLASSMPKSRRTDGVANRRYQARVQPR